MRVRDVELALHEEGDFISQAIRQTGEFYEAAILDALAERVVGEGVIVDVGAHIGNHTTFFAHYLPYTVIHAFEPEPRSRALLKVNVVPYHQVAVHPEALSNWDGSGVLHNWDPGNLGHFTLSTHPVGAYRRKVPVRTLDSFGFTGVKLLKVDVEGSELFVLRGAERTIAESRPLILLEDWERELDPHMHSIGYQMMAGWPDSQTYLYGPC